MNGPTGSDQRACPNAAELAAFLGDGLPAAAMDEIAAHVSSCRYCDDAVRQTDGAPEALRERLRSGAGARALAPTHCLPTGPPPNTPPPAPPPVQLGQYLLGEQLGQGGMGTVYRAEHVRLKKSVAVKVLAPGQVRDPRAVARFQLEMEVVGRLDHPNIVRATDAGEADGTHFLVMELIEGVTLAHLLLRCGPLPVAVACELVRQAAAGLQHAHEHGLVHRDVKPANLMLTPSGQVKLLDLGLARLRAAPLVGSGLTGTGEVMGTAEYMAPEQYTETHSVDARADVYSLGCTLYALLTGDPPFTGPGRKSFLRIMWAHQQEPVRPVAESRADVPPALSELLARMLAKSPDDRPATPSAIAADLEPLAAGADLRGLSGVAPPGTDTVANRPASARGTPPPGTAARRHRRKHLALAAVLAAVLTAVAVGVGVYLTAPAPVPPPPPPKQDPKPSAELSHEPGKWRDLLGEPPVERLWVPTTESLLHFQPDKEILTVQSGRAALLRLGETAAKGYKLQVGFRQIQWQSGFGVYFGGRTQADRDVFAFHVIYLRDAPRVLGRDFALCRAHGEFARGHGGAAEKADVARIEFAMSLLPPLDSDERLLELEVRPHGLTTVRWDGVVCQELTNGAAVAATKKLFPEQYPAGEFGIFCRGSTATVTTARYITTE